MLPALDARVEEDRRSSRSLDEVGPLAVLGAMVEQRRRSASLTAARELDDVQGDDAVATQRRERLKPGDDVFQKIR